MEYDYACCAKQCGIVMSESRLFPSKAMQRIFLEPDDLIREIENGMVKAGSYADGSGVIRTGF